MSMRPALAVLHLVAIFASCNVGNGSECEDARDEIVRHINELCRDATTAYPRSAFCVECVDRQYHATTGAALCQCRPLTFDADFCTYAKGPESKAHVRSAIDWANTQCAHFSLPGDDGGVDDATTEPSVSEDSLPSDAATE